MKKRGHHTSVEKELKQAIKWLESLPYAQKVVFGRVESCRHTYSPGTLRYSGDAPGGIKIKAYGGIGIMDIYAKVLPTYKDILIKAIQERFA